MAEAVAGGGEAAGGGGGAADAVSSAVANPLGLPQAESLLAKEFTPAQVEALQAYLRPAGVETADRWSYDVAKSAFGRLSEAPTSKSTAHTCTRPPS